MALATNTETRGRRATSRAKDDFMLDHEKYLKFGQEMATAATQQTSTAETYWNTCRSLFIEAQQHKRTGEALVDLFSPGDNIKGRKAPWYRTYKSLLTACHDRKIKVTEEDGVTAIQAKIKEAKQAEIDNDPEKAEEKNQQMVEMFRRQAQGCLNRGIPKTQLAAILKELQPAAE